MFKNFIKTTLTPFLTRHPFIIQILGLKKIWVVEYNSLIREDEDYSFAIESLRRFMISGYNLKELSTDYIEQNADISIRYKRKSFPHIIVP